MRLDDQGDHDDGDHHVGAGAELEEQALGAIAKPGHGDRGDHLMRRARGRPVAGDEIGERRHPFARGAGQLNPGVEGQQVGRAVGRRGCVADVADHRRGVLDLHPADGPGGRLEAIEAGRQLCIDDVRPGGQRADAKTIAALLDPAQPGNGGDIEQVFMNRPVHPRRIMIGAAGDDRQPPGAQCGERLGQVFGPQIVAQETDPDCLCTYDISMIRLPASRQTRQQPGKGLAIPGVERREGLIGGCQPRLDGRAEQRLAATGQAPQGAPAVGVVGAAGDQPALVQSPDDPFHGRRIHGREPAQPVLRHLPLVADLGQGGELGRRQLVIGEARLEDGAGALMGAAQHMADLMFEHVSAVVAHTPG